MDKLTIAQYQTLNHSFKRELVFHLGTDAGFYSEFNNMVLAMVYCMQYHVKFSLYSSDANFKFKNGWEDYFLPFCDEIGDPFHHKYNIRYEDPFFLTHGFERLKILYWRMCNKHTFLTSDLFYKFRYVEFERKIFSFHELGVSGDLREMGGHFINLVYRFNDNTKNEILSLVNKLHLPNEYVGFHIRGGDKFVEHEIEQCTAYISRAEQLTTIRTAFVLTDDYMIIKTLQKNYPYWTFCTLTEPSEKGYFHNDFLKKTVLEKKNDLIKLFSAMEVLRRSKVFVGTFSSNPGMFLGMCMKNAHGVDFDRWLLW